MRLPIIIAATALVFAATPAHATPPGFYADVSFTQCVYTNRAHTKYVTTRTLAVTNFGPTIDRARVKVITDGVVTRDVILMLSQLGRVDLHIPIHEGQTKDVVVKYRGGRSEIFRLRHRSVCETA